MGRTWLEMPRTCFVLTNLSYLFFRMASRGKWPPGERLLTNKMANKVPKQSKQKLKARKTKRGRAKTKSDKTYSCNFCNLTFDNRFMYSSHCSSTEHKENVFGRNKPVQSYARGGKAKSISMMTKPGCKPVQYESDTTEDYEKNIDEQKKAIEQTEKADEQVETEVGEAAEKETSAMVETVEENVVAQDQSVEQNNESKQTVVEALVGKDDTPKVPEQTQVYTCIMFQLNNLYMI